MSMNLRLFSHINADGDLIEAWLKYYLRLGVDWFHLVVHGPAEENEKLLAIKDSYPITIEDAYQGPFPAPLPDSRKPNNTEKKNRLDALLARYTGQWVLVVDSDEFVEFPFEDIPETIRKLEFANANLMPAPMLQRLKTDGSLDSPAVIEDPFTMFPLCSVDLYRRMGIKVEIFKFPLFFCEPGTELVEEGNHYPPLGAEPRPAGVVGVTHHFKFRRTLSGRLEKRINSPHLWRQDSVGLRDYLDDHSNRLPLEGAFLYSREELIRRRLLRQLPPSKQACPKSAAQSPVVAREGLISASRSDTKAPLAVRKLETVQSGRRKKIVFMLSKANEFGGPERHLLELLCRLPKQQLTPTVMCFGRDLISAHMDDHQQGQTVVKCSKEPQSLWEWLRLTREDRPDIIVFSYSWLEAFPWRGCVAAALAAIPNRIFVQYRMPPQPPPPVEARSIRGRIRRLIGRQARNALCVKISARTCSFLLSSTVCVSNAIRDALVKIYRFRPNHTIVIQNGVSITTFTPSETHGAAVRAQLGIDREEFLLVCVARLVEVKGIDILIRAVSKVLRQGVQCKLIVLGDGPLREKLQQQTNSEGLWDDVFFEGFQRDVQPYLQAASAFILTSHSEGLPISVLEALACGLPCIVTNVGGSAEAVEDQVTGLVIPPASVEAAADAILDLATNRDKCASMASKAREVVSQSFDIETQMSALIRVITQKPASA